MEEQQVLAFEVRRGDPALLHGAGGGRYLMERFDWATFLREYNAELLRSELIAEALIHAEDDDLARAVEDGWLGYPGAMEEQLARAEERLGMALPPSYRAFLRTSNGWRWPGTLVPRLWSAEELEWFRLTDRETIEIWSGPDARPELGELLRRALRISDREIAGTAVYLLVPEPTASDGECEAWLFAHWVPREVRYRSFRELMEAERRSFAEQEAHTAKGMRPSDTPAQLPRKLLNLIGELEAKVRTYRYIGELNSMPDLTAAETAAALQEVADSLRELQNEDLTPDRLLTALGELRERTELEHLSIHQRWIERRSTLDLLHLAHAAREMSRGEGLRQAAALIGWFIGEAD